MIRIGELEVLRERITFLQGGDKILAVFNYETELFDLYDMDLNQEKFLKTVDLRWIICVLASYSIFTGHFGEILWDLTQLTLKEVGLKERADGSGYDYI